MAETKYCKHCGQVIDADCVVCPKCGKQVEDLKTDQKNVIINNNNSSSASSSASSAAAASASQRVYVTGKPKNKWGAFFLCLFTLCGHKFYEGKFGYPVPLYPGDFWNRLDYRPVYDSWKTESVLCIDNKKWPNRLWRNLLGLS